MIELSLKLPQLTAPDWLSGILNNRLLPEKIPLLSILDDSLFYPASGLDTTPIELTSLNIFSFVYCDYSISKKYFTEFLSNRIPDYSLVGGRFINRDEIVPDSWVPDVPTHFDFDDYWGYNLLKSAQDRCEQFGHWSVWEKENEASTEKSQRNIISLLFIAGEGVACYQGLYLRNKVSPKILSIIQPGHTLGGNWTNFFNPYAPFWKSVKNGKLPDRLLLGEYIQNSLNIRHRYSSPPYSCPFRGDYFPIDVISYSENIWGEKVIGSFELDNRTNEEKEQENIGIERKKSHDEAERKTLQIAWFEQYKKLRLNFKKSPVLKIKMSHEEELERQLFDKDVNIIIASRNMFGALRRRDAIAISSLIKRGADIGYKNNDGLSILEYSEKLGLEIFFTK